MFKSIYSILKEGQTISISITKTGENLVASAKPVGKTSLPSITATGTPSELNKGFFKAMRTSIAKTANLEESIKSYDEQLAKKAEEDKKKREAKSAKKNAKTTKAETPKKKDSNQGSLI